jgi:hypothetical protein
LTVYTVRFSSFLCCKLLFVLEAARCAKGSGYVCLHGTLTLIRLMMSSCGKLCWYVWFVSRQMWKVLCQSLDNCSLYWLCCWVRCWMLQDMGRMEARYIF